MKPNAKHKAMVKAGTLETNPLVSLAHGVPTTTSLVVADKFKKRHADVLRAVKTLDCSAHFNERNFALVTYPDSKGEDRPLFIMTRDGFMMLVMGFTGKPAMAWKERFIEAFNAMEQRLMNLASQPWREVRDQGKIARRDCTDAVQAFVDYAKAQGSGNAEKYYLVITKATYAALFLIGSKAPKDFRDMLDAMQLSFLGTAEHIAAMALHDGMERGLPYKEVYCLARDRVQAFAETTGPKTMAPRSKSLTHPKHLPAPGRKSTKALHENGSGQGKPKAGK